MSEFLHHLTSWRNDIDTWIVVTGALTTMACALPGLCLVLRRQSLMGDALSHTVFLGIVLAYLGSSWLRGSHGGDGPATSQSAIFAGAISIGILSAALTEWLHTLGRVESSAALGVVFTSLFALGLLLMRAFADDVHLDPDCVLYGTIDTVGLGGGVPRAALVGGGMLIVNLGLTVLFFKELKITTFDPALATTLGVPATLVNHALMAVTAATLTAAFESVGSILVIAMLIVPAATATMLSERLGGVIAWSLGLAAAGAAIGHVLAITLPPMIFGRLGYSDVKAASTAGMMALASRFLFVGAMLFAPRHGVLSRLWHQASLRLRFASEDVLGQLYRGEEPSLSDAAAGGRPAKSFREIASLCAGHSRAWTRAALVRLRRGGLVAQSADGWRLTDSGRVAAARLVRAHRLWESYMARHFALPGDHLHESAELVEHYLDPVLRDELAAELSGPAIDPHGREIPAETNAPAEPLPPRAGR